MCCYWQELGNALSNLEVWLVDGIDWGGGFFGFSRQYLKRVSWFCAKGISKLQSCDFCEHCTNRPETGRFSSSLLQDWLAPSRLVLAPDPLRLSGAFAAAKAAAQLATAKVGVHLHSL